MSLFGLSSPWNEESRPTAPSLILPQASLVRFLRPVRSRVGTVQPLDVQLAAACLPVPRHSWMGEEGLLV